MAYTKSVPTLRSSFQGIGLERSTGRFYLPSFVTPTLSQFTSCSTWTPSHNLCITQILVCWPDVKLLIQPTNQHGIKQNKWWLYKMSYTHKKQKSKLELTFQRERSFWCAGLFLILSQPSVIEEVDGGSARSDADSPETWDVNNRTHNGYPMLSPILTAFGLQLSNNTTEAVTNRSPRTTLQIRTLKTSPQTTAKCLIMTS